MSSSELTISEKQSTFTPKQLTVLNLQGASESDLAVFFHQIRRTGLDPFAHQIYMIPRDGKQTIQTGIDGYRLIARRAVDATHETLSYEDALWCGSNGQWRDVWLSSQPPAAAKVTIHRGQGRYSAIALFSEYAGRKKNGQLMHIWETKAALMLAKCAEALALRKAFPQDLSGIYTVEEMQQADNPATATITHATTPPQPVAAPVEEMIDQGTWNLLIELAKQRGLNETQLEQVASWASHGRTTNTAGLTMAEAERLINAWQHQEQQEQQSTLYAANSGGEIPEAEVEN